MKNKYKFLALASFILIFSSCENIFEPMNENLIDETYATTDPASAEGMLLNAYANVVGQYTFTDAATDDAVHNQLTNGYRRMATGELTAIYNPLNRWNLFGNVFYANKFLQVVDSIVWMKDPKGYSIQNELFKKRLRGEALALRALHHWYILENFAGKDNTGTLMGIPFYSEYIPSNGNFNVPRLTFAETVAKIQEDYEAAFKLLPYIYSDNATDIPAKDKPLKYTGTNWKNDSALYISKLPYKGTDWKKDSAYYMANYNAAYTTVNSTKFNLRLNGKIVYALQARLKLFASSKAFLDSEAGYKEAANYATSVLVGNVIAPDGVEFYNADPDNVNPEILWRKNVSSSSTQEANNFPPTLNGKGNVNPTQNLVDAFYMKDGYPIGLSPTNVYSPQTPYANRDPRLDKFVVYNGGKMGTTTITTTATDSKNGVNAVPEQSTRTGYYLKKLLRPDVVIPASGTAVAKNHFESLFRYTELYLILAEAQNEIGGPTYKEGASTQSAKDIMKLIRKRAMAITVDPYLDGITSKEAMRTLIQNERRLELCFEGFRFFDLRRWGLPLNETVKGLYDNGTGAGYQLIDVEIRAFNAEKHRYLPLPYNEIRKYTSLTQNAGW
ncbi:MAG: RagB/SusD family nutrient uptake outer membrane protein [Paludibacter sp.]|nr:RagB/SusD family nutrient uptake outer membrane protein [Paludibacter sp.]